jgi:hypothetical protein
MIKKILSTIIVAILFGYPDLFAQTIGFDKSDLEVNRVYLSIEKMNGKKVVKVVIDSTVKGANEPTFVKIKGIDFKDGTIELKVLSRC